MPSPRNLPPKQGGILVTTINSAELIKHASNSFLALKISYAASSRICERSARTSKKPYAMGLDTRIGDNSEGRTRLRRLLFSEGRASFIYLSSKVEWTLKS
jgi:hypothetical protein